MHRWSRIRKVNWNKCAEQTKDINSFKEVVATDNKGRYRFSPDGKRIKACQGHSIPWVEPELKVRTPPEYLYHGATTEALQDIMKCGAILRMSRHAVHMQEDVNKAWQSAARRRSKTPVVLKIDAKRMSQTGAVFTIFENDVWFCERVPTEYIEEFLYTKEHK